MSLAALVVVCLVLIARQEEQPALVQLPPVVAPPVVAPPVDHTESMLVEVEAFLAMLKLDSREVQREPKATSVHYTVKGGLPPSALIDDLAMRLLKLSDAYTVTVSVENALMTVKQAGQEKATIYFLSQEPPPPAGPQVAIIMDDLGRGTYQAQVLLALTQPVTFSVLPDEAQAVAVAEMGYAGGREVMLHVPMEPQGYPDVNPGKAALFVRYSDTEIKRRFDAFLDLIPHVVGINNHMGSRFTEDARALGAVMERSREKGLFFIDSLTTGNSRVTEVAQRNGVPTLSRDVFLDNVAEIEAISRQIELLVKKAHQQGMAIGICHPYPQTFEALRRELPGLAARGVEVVPVSVLLKRMAFSQVRE